MTPGPRLNDHVYSQSRRHAGGMMQRALRLADMLPISVSLLCADAWTCSLAKVGAKQTNPVLMPTVSVIAAKIVERFSV